MKQKNRKRINQIILVVIILLATGWVKADDKPFHVTLGGSLWYCKWSSEYDWEATLHTDRFEEQYHSRAEIFLKAEYKRWTMRIDGIFIDDEDIFDDLYYETARDDYTFDLGFAVFTDPYIRPFIAFRLIDIDSQVSPYMVYGGTHYWLDHHITAWEAGIETIYPFGETGLAVEGRIAVSVLGDYSIKIRWDNQRNRGMFKYDSDDVRLLDWTAGISYRIPEIPFKITAGYKQSTEHVEYVRSDVNHPWNPKPDSDIRGPFISLSATI